MPPGRKPSPETEAARKVELLHESLRRSASQSLAAYLAQTVVDSVPTPRRFCDIREPWQERRDESLIPAIEYVAGVRPDYNGPRNFWYGYPKAHDKSSGVARYLNWLLAFSPRKQLRMYCGAKDAGQAAVILDCMVREAALNPWYAGRLDFKRNRVEGRENGAQLHILTSDAEGAHGILPDFVICDELSHWHQSDLFDALFSGSAKRAGHCVFCIATNAGYRDTWQYQLREMAKAEDGRSWRFYETPPGQILASWLSKDVIEQTKRMMSPTEAKRLYENCWIDLSEDRGAFRPEDVDLCVGEPKQPPPGATVVLCVDYGQVNDPTALGAVWYDGDKVHVVELECWAGSHDAPVQVEAVDAWLDGRLLKYPNAVCVFDQSQMIASMQRLEKRGHAVKAFPYRGGRQNRVMLETLQTMLANRKIVFADYAGFNGGDTLKHELKRIIVKRMTYGLRLDHEAHGHDDRTVVIGMAAMEAITLAPPPSVRQSNTLPPKQLPPFRPGGGFSSEWFSKRGWFNTQGR